MTWTILVVFFIGFWIGFLAACLFAAAGRADETIDQLERCRRCEITRDARIIRDDYRDSIQN